MGIFEIPGILVSWLTDSANDGAQTASREANFTTNTWVGAAFGAVSVITACPFGGWFGCGVALGGYLTNDAVQYYNGMYYENTALLDRQAGRTVATALAVVANGSWGFCAGAPNTPAYYCCTYSVQGGEYCYCAGCGTPDASAEPLPAGAIVSPSSPLVMEPLLQSQQTALPATEALVDYVEPTTAALVLEPTTTGVEELTQSEDFVAHVQQIQVQSDGELDLDTAASLIP